MTRPLKAGVIGVGLAGGPHLEAIGRTGLAEAVAVAASSEASARRAAERWAVPGVHGDWHALVQDPAIDVVHNCTPNHLHAEVAHAVLAAGKHLITEKPLAMNVADATALVAAAAETPLTTAFCHNYRSYAMVTEAHELIGAGAIGEVFHVHGVYLQDWLSDGAVRNWRLDPAQSGASTTFADLGTHWCDLAMHLSGRRIETVSASIASRHGRPIDDHGGVLFALRRRRARDARLLAGLTGGEEQPPDPPGRIGGIAVLGPGAPRGAMAGTPGRSDRAAPQVSRSAPRARRAPGPSARGRDRGVEHHVRQPLRLGVPQDPGSAAAR